jgi:flagellar hook-associated protein 3 FlgL
MIRQLINALRDNKGSINRSLGQLADGKRVRVASDDPSGARVALEIRGRLIRTEGYRRSANAAVYDLDTVEESLGTVLNVLVDIRSEAMAGASGTVQDANDIRATEVEALRNQLLLLANTSQNGRYLFGGTETLTRPFDDTGAYQGNGQEVQASIDEELSVGVTLAGDEIFQGGGDIFTTLSDLADALRNDDSAAIQSLISDLNGEMDHVNEIRTKIGTRQQLLQRTLDDIDSEQFRLQSRIAEIENVDFEQVAVELSAANSNFESISLSGARALGLSLFDYLG